jgi:acetyl-CoA synthetase
VTNIVDEADFDAERWYRILEAQQVTVWYTAPTAIRRLMRLPIEPRTQYDLNHLRLIHSVGEPLNPEAVVWGEKALGLPIHDNWWQTETGGIMIANYPVAEIRPGSMGRPLPGIEAAIVRRKDDAVEVVTEPDMEGDLALKPGWPSMFRGYLHDEERTINASPMVGILPATSRGAMRMATFGSSDARTTSSRPPATWLGRSRSRAR